MTAPCVCRKVFQESITIRSSQDKGCNEGPKVYTLMREIELKPSRRLGLLLTGMFLLALVALYLAALPGGLQLALGMAADRLERVGLAADSPRWASLRIAADGELQYLDETGANGAMPTCWATVLSRLR